MGLPAERLTEVSNDIIVEIDLKSSPLRPGLVLHKNDTPDNLELVQSYAREHASFFWGEVTEDENGDIPQTLVNKIGILKDTITVIPELETYEPMAYDWVNGERNSEKKIELLTKRRIGVELPSEISKNFRKTPITAIDVYNTPAVYEIAHRVLVEIGNPVIRAIDTYELHLLDNEIDPRARKLGETALMHFAFGTGGQPFVELLGSANRSFHETELNLQKLKKKH